MKPSFFLQSLAVIGTVQATSVVSVEQEKHENHLERRVFNFIAQLGGAVLGIFTDLAVGELGGLLGFDDGVMNIAKESIDEIARRVENIVQSTVNNAFKAEYMNEAQALVDQMLIYKINDNDYDKALDMADKANIIAHKLDDDIYGITTSATWQVMLGTRMSFLKEMIRITELEGNDPDHVVTLKCAMSRESARAQTKMQWYSDEYIKLAAKVIRKNGPIYGSYPCISKPGATCSKCPGSKKKWQGNIRQMTNDDPEGSTSAIIATQPTCVWKYECTSVNHCTNFGAQLEALYQETKLNWINANRGLYLGGEFFEVLQRLVDIKNDIDQELGEAACESPSRVASMRAAGLE